MGKKKKEKIEKRYIAKDKLLYDLRHHENYPYFHDGDYMQFQDLIEQQKEKEVNGVVCINAEKLLYNFRHFDGYAKFDDEDYMTYVELIQSEPEIKKKKSA